MQARRKGAPAAAASATVEILSMSNTSEEALQERQRPSEPVTSASPQPLWTIEEAIAQVQQLQAQPPVAKQDNIIQILIHFQDVLRLAQNSSGSSLPEHLARHSNLFQAHLCGLYKMASPPTVATTTLSATVALVNHVVQFVIPALVGQDMEAKAWTLCIAQALDGVIDYSFEASEKDVRTGAILKNQPYRGILADLFFSTLIYISLSDSPSPAGSAPPLIRHIAFDLLTEIITAHQRNKDSLRQKIPPSQIAQLLYDSSDPLVSNASLELAFRLAPEASSSRAKTEEDRQRNSEKRKKWFQSVFPETLFGTDAKFCRETLKGATTFYIDSRDVLHRIFNGSLQRSQSFNAFELSYNSISFPPPSSCLSHPRHPSSPTSMSLPFWIGKHIVAALVGVQDEEEARYASENKTEDFQDGAKFFFSLSDVLQIDVEKRMNDGKLLVKFWLKDSPFLAIKQLSKNLKGEDSVAGACSTVLFVIHINGFQVLNKTLLDRAKTYHRVYPNILKNGAPVPFDPMPPFSRARPFMLPVAKSKVAKALNAVLKPSVSSYNRKASQAGPIPAGTNDAEELEEVDMSTYEERKEVLASIAEVDPEASGGVRGSFGVDEVEEYQLPPPIMVPGTLSPSKGNGDKPASDRDIDDGEGREQEDDADDEMEDGMDEDDEAMGKCRTSLEATLVTPESATLTSPHGATPTASSSKDPADHTQVGQVPTLSQVPRTFPIIENTPVITLQDNTNHTLGFAGQRVSPSLGPQLAEGSNIEANWQGSTTDAIIPAENDSDLTSLASDDDERPNRAAKVMREPKAATIAEPEAPSSNIRRSPRNIDKSPARKQNSLIRTRPRIVKEDLDSPSLQSAPSSSWQQLAKHVGDAVSDPNTVEPSTNARQNRSSKRLAGSTDPVVAASASSRRPPPTSKKAPTRSTRAGLKQNPSPPLLPLDDSSNSEDNKSDKEPQPLRRSARGRTSKSGPSGKVERGELPTDKSSVDSDMVSVLPARKKQKMAVAFEDVPRFQTRARWNDHSPLDPNGSMGTTAKVSDKSSHPSTLEKRQEPIQPKRTYGKGRQTRAAAKSPVLKRPPKRRIVVRKDPREEGDTDYSADQSPEEMKKILTRSRRKTDDVDLVGDGSLPAPQAKQRMKPAGPRKPTRLAGKKVDDLVKNAEPAVSEPRLMEGGQTKLPELRASPISKANNDGPHQDPDSPQQSPVSRSTPELGDNNASHSAFDWDREVTQEKLAPSRSLGHSSNQSTSPAELENGVNKSSVNAAREDNSTQAPKVLVPRESPPSVQLLRQRSSPASDRSNWPYDDPSDPVEDSNHVQSFNFPTSTLGNIRLLDSRADVGSSRDTERNEPLHPSRATKDSRAQYLGRYLLGPSLLSISASLTSINTVLSVSADPDGAPATDIDEGNATGHDDMEQGNEESYFQEADADDSGVFEAQSVAEAFVASQLPTESFVKGTGNEAQGDKYSNSVRADLFLIHAF
ncbi:hypothetical protein T439DRAFT_212040 [Meredithblackwellia eburnea MCA 4105]